LGGRKIRKIVRRQSADHVERVPLGAALDKQSFQGWGGRRRFNGTHQSGEELGTTSLSRFQRQRAKKSGFPLNRSGKRGEEEEEGKKTFTHPIRPLVSPPHGHDIATKHWRYIASQGGLASDRQGGVNMRARESSRKSKK